MATSRKTAAAHARYSQARWRSAQGRALEGAVDLRAMGSSLLRLARLLNGKYDIVCRPAPSRSLRALSPAALNDCFRSHQERRSAAFLNRARASGKRWRDVPHFLADATDREDEILRKNYLQLLGWQGFKGQLLEGLCLLAALSRFGYLGKRIEVDVFGQNGPIPVDWAGRTVFLWTQARLPITRSSLKARPDLLCSSTETLDRRPDIEWIIEAKCRGALTSHELRAEFGKAFDLESPAYTVVTFKQPTQAIQRAAAEFGIDVQVFPLLTNVRAEYVAGSRSLEEDLATQLIHSRDQRHFAQRVLAKGQELERKLLRA